MKYCWRCDAPDVGLGSASASYRVDDGLVVVVPRPRVRERLETVERDAARRRDRRARSSCRTPAAGKKMCTRADRVDDVGERREVELRGSG